jgi:hypothetical protein
VCAASAPVLERSSSRSGRTRQALGRALIVVVGVWLCTLVLVPLAAAAAGLARLAVA